MPRTFCLFLSLIIFLAGVSVVGAERLAVFPVEDLSQGKNSVNLEFTEYLAQRLATKGLEIRSKSEVISFMANNRIRWAGYLDTKHVLMAREELGVDFLLFGTICQRSESATPALGLTLQLVRTSDAYTIWSDSGGLSTADVQHLLGLAEPSTVEELLPLLAKNVMASWPAVFESPLSQDYSQSALQANEIESVFITPKHLRPGEEVRCTVRLKAAAEGDVRPLVYIKAGNRVYLAQGVPDRMEYEAAWIGSEGSPRGPVVDSQGITLAALNTDASGIFESIWVEEDKDDHYPVSLVLSWPSGKQEAFFVGSYVVDSRAPEARLGLVGPNNIEGKIIFKDKVEIIPQTAERERLSRWQITAENEEGRVVVSEEGEGNLPYRFTWRGRLGNGRQVEEGLYEIILRTWDYAGNMGISSQSVFYMPTPPILEVQARSRQGTMQLDISHEGSVPLDYWYMEIWTDQGILLKVVEGEELPATVEVSPEQLAAAGKMAGYLFARDVLGNNSRQELKDLSLLAMQKNVDEAAPEANMSNEWNVDF